MIAVANVLWKERAYVQLTRVGQEYWRDTKRLAFVPPVLISMADSKSESLPSNSSGEQTYAVRISP